MEAFIKAFDHEMTVVFKDQCRHAVVDSKFSHALGAKEQVRVLFSVFEVYLR